jgi:hypothetical protein
LSNETLTVELTRAERRFLRAMALRIVQDSAGLLRLVERERSPTIHREASENLELSAGLLAKLPKDDTSDKT